MQSNGTRTKGWQAAGLSAMAAIAVIFSLGLDASAQDAKAPAPKTASACKGIDEMACKGKAGECLWIVPSKGKQKPYCRTRVAGRKKA